MALVAKMLHSLPKLTVLLNITNAIVQVPSQEPAVSMTIMADRCSETV